MLALHPPAQNVLLDSSNPNLEIFLVGMPENTTTAGNGTITQEQCNIGLLIIYISFINDKGEKLCLP